MKLSAPTTPVWMIAVILGVLGILVHFAIVPIAALAAYDVWLIIIGFVLLVLATLLKGV